jgi:hypothetical protein
MVSVVLRAGGPSRHVNSSAVEHRGMTHRGGEPTAGAGPQPPMVAAARYDMASWWSAGAESILGLQDFALDLLAEVAAGRLAGPSAHPVEPSLTLLPLASRSPLAQALMFSRMRMRIFPLRLSLR